MEWVLIGMLRMPEPPQTTTPARGPHQTPRSEPDRLCEVLPATGEQENPNHREEEPVMRDLDGGTDNGVTIWR